ncbi:uncharacterized protein ARMOST_00892 [Armillaria ostoyae]|uniref:Uncharacterized protein n=1 Tax=Armillaria ostoyae TaxID=47428 RepID=A0A284QMF6_ARMOS|nr:uncharacterized protein ARMOST_00892 [Armillaria ostoyae]
MAGKHGKRSSASKINGKREDAKKALKKKQRSSHKFQNAEMRDKLDSEAQALYTRLAQPVSSVVQSSSRQVHTTVDDLSTVLSSGL